MTMRYGHTFDVAFTVYADDPDWESISLEQLLVACRQRLAEADVEAFGFVDTMEVEDA